MKGFGHRGCCPFRYLQRRTRYRAGLILCGGPLQQSTNKPESQGMDSLCCCLLIPTKHRGSAMHVTLRAKAGRVQARAQRMLQCPGFDPYLSSIQSITALSRDSGTQMAEAPAPISLVEAGRKSISLGLGCRARMQCVSSRCKAWM